MEAAIESVLKEFHERSEREGELYRSLSSEEFHARIDEFLLPIGPEAGRLVNLLIKTRGARAIVEVGTSHGYSAVWLAEAARATGGHVTSFDIHAGKQEYARQALERAGLAQFVEFVLGDAQELIPQLPGSVEFALVDHWKSLYVPCYEVLLPKLAPEALIVADNMIFPEDREGHIRAYLERVRGTTGMETVTVPIGNGLELSRYAGP
ncbi:MAG: class I SAM-dependent methyltransferase [SAR324 cluster bacterium]|nr:class I SAM-dependent methyltransferase [SAR324 cluster bacterium]